MHEIAEFLAGVAKQGKKVLVLCHHTADPDAVGSCAVLAEALQGLGASAKAGTSEDLSRAAQAVLAAVGRRIEVNPPIDADVVVLLDTSSFEHLGKLGEEVKRKAPPLVLLDHHRPVEGMKEFARFYLVREDVSSEAELVLELIRELGVELTPDWAFLLLAGIISDTGQFRLAKSPTFGVVDTLLRAGADYQRVLDALKLPEDPSKRIAMLKAAQRAELERVHERFVVFSEVGSFEADAAAMLVKVGADVAIVGSEEKGKLRLSARARPEVCAETSLHLGELMAELGKLFRGAGGGHAGAASMGGEGKLEEAKKHALKILQEKLKPKG